MASYTSDRTGAEIDTTLDNADSHIADLNNPHAVAAHQLTRSLETLTEQSGSIELDFDTAYVKVITITTDASFSTLNRGPGKSLQLRIVCDATANSNLDWPAWKWMNTGGEPLVQTFPNEALLSLICYGTADTDIRAVWLEEGA